MTRAAVAVGRLPAFLWRAVALALYLAWTCLASSVRVAASVLAPRTGATPGVVALPLEARTDLEITLVANAISLTPGTLSLDLSDDRRILWVHAMFTDGDPDHVARKLGVSVERRVLSLLRTWEEVR